MQNSKLQFKIKNLQKTKSLEIGNWKLEIPALRAGFTLIEMVIYMALFSILLMILVDIFASSVDLEVETLNTSTVRQDSAFIRSRLAYDIHRAQTITIPTAIASTSSSLQLVIDGINYTYSVVNGKLGQTSVLGTDTLNGFNTKIADINFIRVGSVSGKQAVRLSLTLESEGSLHGKKETKIIQTTVGVR